MQKKILFFFLLITSVLYAQNKPVILYGKVTDSFNPIENTHVFNLNTKQGTFTNKEGLFRIFAKENDNLQLSSIGYETIIFKVTTYSLGLNANTIQLKIKEIELDEVEIKKHNLLGALDLDIKQVPQDKVLESVDSWLEEIMNMSEDAKKNLPIGKDELHLVKPNKVNIANSFKGVGGSFGIGGKSSKQKKELELKLEAKQNFPKRILSLLGKDFFYNDLKIPKDNYYHFIDYCSYKSIEKLFKNEEILELIRIFQEESISYLKVIKKQD
ncbi:hypothetical protein LPB136_05060 [Tenacibaculum todarodis]|uniref:TonB-dependent receptor n=1 Tax=Tenacibaculum todarodis TaxID=1850252 RepID=A0A1L3JI19_9FLAO|nr:carboxypeptidase-like regulatory domain-containing protein [Tenacibaculum todarodis]APG64768.1 hypothetical protein LPB136_05060 [Tenacibaculum todarodis]